MPVTETFAALIGVDWSDKKHDVALRATYSDEVELSVVAHTPEAIHAWVARLRQCFEGQRVALCTEQKQGVGRRVALNGMIVKVF